MRGTFRCPRVRADVYRSPAAAIAASSETLAYGAAFDPTITNRSRCGSSASPMPARRSCLYGVSEHAAGRRRVATWSCQTD